MTAFATEIRPPQPSPALPSGIAKLSQWGVIRASGPEAAAFLNGQLTQDFALLGDTQARLAALCSAKGRMLASFIGFKRGNEEVLLLCSRDILAATLKRLSMFVLRAKVKLSDASAEFSVYGLLGDAITGVAGGAHAAWAKQDIGLQSLVHLYPALGQPRALCIAPAGLLPIGIEGCPALSEDLWRYSEVRSGVATITQPVVDAFVPQMLNYESVGGVSFKKGCYPGQEVVARSQFRGSLKRRAFLVHSAIEIQPGQEIYADLPANADLQTVQPCGSVVQSAPALGGGFDAVVSMQTAHADALLSVPVANSASLQVLSLPYPLLDDI